MPANSKKDILELQNLEAQVSFADVLEKHTEIKRKNVYQ